MATKRRSQALVIRQANRVRTRYIRARSHRGRSSYRTPGFAVAPVLGLVPTIGDMMAAVRRGEGSYGAVRFGVLDFTGYDILQKTWSVQYLLKGWAPVVLGIVAHAIANRTGINRMIHKTGIPVVI